MAEAGLPDDFPIAWRTAPVRRRDPIVVHDAKTAFVQALARALGITAPVTSPTYAIARVYEGPVRLHHLDVYRLGDADELMDLDLPAMVEEEAVTLIEWGDLILPALPTDLLEVRITLGEADDDRRLCVAYRHGRQREKVHAGRASPTGGQGRQRCQFPVTD